MARRRWMRRAQRLHPRHRLQRSVRQDQRARRSCSASIPIPGAGGPEVGEAMFAAQENMGDATHIMSPGPRPRPPAWWRSSCLRSALRDRVRSDRQDQGRTSTPAECGDILRGVSPSRPGDARGLASFRACALRSRRSGTHPSGGAADVYTSGWKTMSCPHPHRRCLAAFLLASAGCYPQIDLSGIGKDDGSEDAGGGVGGQDTGSASGRGGEGDGGDGSPEMCVVHDDIDGDGFGDPETGREVPCEDLDADAVLDDSDCDDTRADVHPAIDELCDAIDNDWDEASMRTTPSMRHLVRRCRRRWLRKRRPGRACAAPRPTSGWRGRTHLDVRPVSGSAMAGTTTVMVLSMMTTPMSI